jgi:hypothetical protein
MSESTPHDAPARPPAGRTVVVSQSMYFPWCGLLEQIRMADVFVHYDDVQYARGFFSRVQVKTEHGIKWLSVPLRDQHRGQTIDECRIDNSTDWRRKHRDVLGRAYRKAPYAAEMLALVEAVFAEDHDSLGSLGRATIRALTEAFDLRQPEFLHAADLGVGGSSSQRLRDITAALGGTVYLTGHGALNYLDHSIFDAAGIEVRYMEYSLGPWPQDHGGFTPFVTALDALAHLGPAAATALHSTTLHWSDALERHRRLSA